MKAATEHNRETPDLGSTSRKIEQPIKLGRILLVLILFKVTYFAVLIPVFQSLDGHDERVMRGWAEAGDSGLIAFAKKLTHWDAVRYLNLSKTGYVAGDPQSAFYPLYPLTIRVGSILIGGNHTIAGLIISNLCSLAAFTIFFGVVRDRFGNGVAVNSLVLLIVFPGAIFYQFIYTESLFLLLLTLLWLGMEKRRYRVAMTAAILLPITRAIGLFVIIPVVWYLLTACDTCIRKKHPDAAVYFRWLRPAAIRECREIWAGPIGLLFIGPIYGWAVYLLFMLWTTGNPFEGFEAQKQWGLHSIGNIFDLPQFLMRFFSPRVDSRFWIFVTDRAAFYLLLLCLPILWRRDKGLFWWAAALGILPAMSGTFWAYTRFAAVVFPVFIAIAFWVQPPKTRILFPVVSLLFLTVHLMFLWRFVAGDWVG